MFDGIIVGSSSGGGSGTTPSLQQVCDVNSITTKSIFAGDYAGGNYSIIDGTGTYIGFYTGGEINSFISAGDFVLFGSAGYFLELYSAGSEQYLIFKNNDFRGRLTSQALNADRYYRLPDADATLVIIRSVNFALTAQSSYSFAHGYAFTPTSATLTPANAGGMTAIAAGYWVEITATNIIVHFPAPLTISSVVFNFLICQ
jgi:hypothetical protein